jgi:hypothetical protein
MQEEPPNKLDGLQGRFFELVTILGIAPAKTHTAVLQAYQSSVGDRHAVGVACEMPQDLLGSTERWLRIPGS